MHFHRHATAIMHSRLRAYTIVACSFCYIICFPACGVEIQLPGINIDRLLVSHAVGSYTPTERAEHLDALLKGYPFPTEHIDEQVLVNLIEKDSMDFSDTDESEDHKDRILSNMQSARYICSSSTNTAKIRLRPSELGLKEDVPPDKSPAAIAKALRVKLSRDALLIASTHHNSRTREATTCLCVVLRDEKNATKKLVFHNGTGKIPPSMRKAAEHLTYGVRNAYLAHAEAQFMDFLLYRARQRTDEIIRHQHPKHPRYTHILGMGCSRKHCQECDTLLKLFLGTSYYACTSAMSRVPMKEQQDLLPTLESKTQDNEAYMLVSIPAQVQSFQVVHQEEAVRSGSHRSINYRMSDRIQTAIRNKSNLTNLDFSAPRFHGRGHIPGAAAAMSSLIQANEDDIQIDGEYEIDDEYEFAEDEGTTLKEKKRKAIDSP